jgi:trk system potassium uptake protein
MSIIIVGGGEVGEFIAEQLVLENKNVILIERDEARCQEIGGEIDAKIVCGNGASPQILHEADLKHSEMVLAVTNSDEVNLLVAVLARMEAPNATRIVRVRSPEFDLEEVKFQQNFDIDLVMNPEKEAARAILRALEVPGAREVHSLFEGRLKLVTVEVKPHCPVINVPLKELPMRKNGERFLLAAIFRNGQLMTPQGDCQIQEEDLISFVAESNQVSSIMKLLGYKGNEAKNVMIYGGDFIGLNLAKALESEGANIKIIEPDHDRCSRLTRSLSKTVILNEEATDQDFLIEENIQDMDVFIAVTQDDEDNILSSLLAKRLGVPWTVALTDEPSYTQLISTIGIDVVINPNQLAINAILHFIRRGKVLQVSPLQEGGEIIEMEALETSEISGKPIHKLRNPHHGHPTRQKYYYS